MTVGSNSYRENNVTSKRAKKVYIHENFTREPLTNDIAVVYVETDFIFSESVKAAVLPTEDDFPKVGKVGLVSGWGAEGEESEILKSTYIKVTEQDVCDQIFEESNGEMPSNTSYFCAAERDYSSSICTVKTIFFLFK